MTPRLGYLQGPQSPNNVTNLHLDRRGSAVGRTRIIVDADLDRDTFASFYGEESFDDSLHR